MKKLLFILLFIILTAGCRPETTYITCDVQDDCPENMYCVYSISIFPIFPTENSLFQLKKSYTIFDYFSIIFSSSIHCFVSFILYDSPFIFTR